MAEILSNKVTFCLRCKKFVSYDKADIQKGEHVYYVYGCEENYAPYKYIVCPKCNKPTRVGTKIYEDGKKDRMCKKCGETF